MTQSNTLVEVKNLKQYFPVTTGFLKTKMLKAVDDVSFTIGRSETLGLVGESGCGKTTVGRTLLHLYKPTGGEVWFDGKKVDAHSMSEFRRRAQMVFQDPYSSLNPRMTVGDIVAEPIDVHHLCKTPKEREDRVHELLKTVGISGEQAARYAHEFSGGQRQRIGIARALASKPEFIVCDEPVSALDVSIQAQVINMMEDLQAQFGLSYLFIAHDLSVVKHISNRIGAFQGTVPPCGAPVFGVAALRRSHARSGKGAKRAAHRAGRRRTQPPQHAFRLLVPHALPPGDGQMRAGMPGAAGN